MHLHKINEKGKWEKMKKVYVKLAAVLSAIALFSGHSFNSAAADYYDYDGKELPVGTEFVSGEYKYRVIKPASIIDYHGIEAMKNGEVELIGFNPDPDYYESIPDYNKKYMKENISIYEEDVEGGYFEFKLVGIADNAFKDNQDIKSIFINSDGLKYIGESAFEGCKNLREFSVRDTDVKNIKARAFYGCESLKEIMLEGDKLKQVGKDAFANTRPKMKLTTYTMTKSHLSKVKKLLMKAGIKKINFKRKRKVI